MQTCIYLNNIKYCILLCKIYNFFSFDLFLFLSWNYRFLILKRVPEPPHNAIMEVTGLFLAYVIVNIATRQDLGSPGIKGPGHAFEGLCS